MHSAETCAQHSKPLVPGKPDSDLICTQDHGHDLPHQACDGRGHVLGRWNYNCGPVQVYVLGQVVTV